MKGQEEASLYAAKIHQDQLSPGVGGVAAGMGSTPQQPPATPTASTPKQEAPDNQGRSQSISYTTGAAPLGN